MHEERRCSQSYRSLGSGASATVTFVVTADFPCLLDNFVSVSANEFDVVPGNNTATTTTTVGAALTPDLSIDKSHSSDFTVGVQDTYAIAVSNVGMGSTTGTITVTDTLPAGLAFVIGTGTGWACSAAGLDVTCTHPGPIAASASAPALTITVQVLGPAGLVSNTASVSTAGDANAANNSDMDPTQINAFPCSKTAVSGGNWSNGAIWNPAGVTGGRAGRMELSFICN